MKKKLGLLYGGKSAEHDVSLSTARAVTQALNFDKFDVFPIFITRDGEWRKGDQLTAPAESIEQLQIGKGTQDSIPNDVSSFLLNKDEKEFDVIFPLLHGTNGEDGTVQGLLEVLNLPYVGNGVLASSAGMDKVVMKQLFEHAGLKQVPYVYFIRKEWNKSQDALIAKMEEELTWPMFVKPANLGSSVGISKASNREELIKAIDLASKYDRKIIVETGIVAREVEMGVLGNDSPKVSVPGEIKPVTDFYDYDSKYNDNNTGLIIPAPVTTDVVERMKDMAIRAFKVLDCSGLVRADFFVTADDDIVINEVNTMPGFTPVSMYPILWQHTGVTYSDLIEQLIDLAIERHDEKQQLQYQ
ncbi:MULTISPECIES: D-alanine--D-alanine ligase [unclassified Viridibacillus]|uniref:D-alanine--D-alanine ligase n=1 Tax=unclassified Viridibacillus TaxID=2617942 RepID=UPI00096C1988|nr:MULTISPECIES: D-alanine--D-alanine ligase [unclassified Viridibacillus]OMC82202.1 D-alanine--D-alanine ligase A [Viridibacillus sp. FSL H8-0123]OMC86359.1 D-alanine--D-alanine ligase A [Viridibacillus sp. FSL H7-0596]